MNHKNDATHPKIGTVFLIGAGPGDPGLITVKGLEKIRTADVIVYDYLAGKDLVLEAKPAAELIYVGKKGKDHTVEQLDINQLLIAEARKGKTVVRLKGGDPYVFGRGGEEAEELVDAGIPFEEVPGVSSAVGAPAYAGIPVTHRDHASMVTFITGHENPDKSESALDWDILARNPGTLVFLMGVKNLPIIAQSLIDHGKAASTPAALVRWGTTTQQVSVVSTLEEIAEVAERRGLKPPAVLVVGTVVSLAGKLGWFERKPLFGKKIVITRSSHQSRRMADAIRTLGGDPVLFPTIRITDAQDTAPLDSAVQRIKDYDWVIFTSVNGVERFFQRFFELTDDIRDMAGPRIGAIGPVTAEALKKRGLKVHMPASDFVAEKVLDLLSEEDVKGKRFLIPRAEKAREILPEGITRMGGIVEEVAVYRTVRPEESNVEEIRRMLEEKLVHAVTFTSSSTATHFAEMMDSDSLASLMDGVVAASIGPITSATLRELGLSVGLEASEYTIDGLLQAMADYFGEKNK